MSQLSQDTCDMWHVTFHLSLTTTATFLPRWPKLQTVVRVYEQLGLRCGSSNLPLHIWYWWIFNISRSRSPRHLLSNVVQFLAGTAPHTWGNKYAGEYSWSHTYLQRVLYCAMDTLVSGCRWPRIIKFEDIQTELSTCDLSVFMWYLH